MLRLDQGKEAYTDKGAGSGTGELHLANDTQPVRRSHPESAAQEARPYGIGMLSLEQYA